MRALLGIFMWLPAQAVADFGERFDALMAQSRINTAGNLDEINRRLSNASQLNTAALSLEGNVTTADRLAAAISTTVDGVESGLAVDLIGLAAGRKQPHSVVLTLGKLSDEGVRSGVAYAFEHAPAASAGDVCPVRAVDSKDTDLRRKFSAVCARVTAVIPAVGGPTADALKTARDVCGPHTDESRTAASQNMKWAGINLHAWARKTGDEALIADTKALKDFQSLRACTQAEAEANLRIQRNDNARHAVGVGVLVDWFPIRSGLQLDEEAAARAGAELEDYENFKSGALLLEGRHGTTLWQLTYGASLKTFREAPREVDRKTAVAPRLSGEVVLASLGKGPRAALGPEDPRMALGLDATLEARLSEDEAEPDDIGAVRIVAATLRLDTTINPRVKVRLALPITWIRTVVPPDAANAAKLGWAFSIPASIVTVLRF